MTLYIQELAQDLVDALAAEGQDDLASSLMLLLGDFDIPTTFPEGEHDANTTH